MSAAIPRNFSQPFRGTSAYEFLWTHSEEILITLFKEFLVTNTREFLVTDSAEKPEKICENLWEFPAKCSSEPIPGNFLDSQDFLRSSSGISWNILSIFLSKFTNQDWGPIVVNIWTTILPPLLLHYPLLRSVTPSYRHYYELSVVKNRVNMIFCKLVVRCKS